MEETGKHHSQRNGVAVLNRLLLWLFVVFAFSEAPFGQGEFFADSENRSGRLSRELRGPAPCAHKALAAKLSTQAQVATPSHFTPKAVAAETNENPGAIPPAPAAIDLAGGSANSIFLPRGLQQAQGVGFSSRAPPMHV